jgi:Mrp family chromosome partitioning ATPase
LSNSEIDYYLPSSSGEVFSEKPCSLIANVPTIKNLSVLPMGKLMENEIYNLSSLETHSLLDSISQDYSLILYDSSGFLESYDLSILADRTQGIILVVRLRGTSHSSLKKAVARINKYQLKLLGFVILSGKSQTASSNRPKRFLVL